METTRCPICNTIQEVISFHKDDPVLLCGHTLTVELQDKRDEIVDILANAQRDMVYRYMRKYKLSYAEANRKLVEDLIKPSITTRVINAVKSLF